MDQSMEPQKGIAALQRLLEGDLAFLLEEGHFCVVDTRASDSDAYILLRSGTTGCRLIRDRHQIFLEFRSLNDKDSYGWITTDVIKRLLREASIDDAKLDAATISFLRARLPEVLEAFSEKKLKATLAAVGQLEKQRARRIFGE